MRFVLFCLSLLTTASPTLSQETLGLAAPPEIADSGLLQHILPRFSLKSGIRVVPDSAGPMALAADPPGRAVFSRDGAVYHLRTGDDARQQRFADWLTSDIGKRTVESFRPDTGAAFSASVEVAAAASAPVFDGDARRGADLSLAHCGRCHVIGAQNRMAGIHSTPSFPVLKALPDWGARFQTFYVRNPHPSFTQVVGITAAFDPERPPPIVPLTITREDLDAILAFVAATPAADLGAPLQFQ